MTLCMVFNAWLLGWQMGYIYAILDYLKPMLKYTNPAIGILDLCKQRFLYGPPMQSKDPILHGKL